LKNIYFSSHKLPKQQSTSFWSQGILGVKDQVAISILHTTRIHGCSSVCQPQRMHITRLFYFTTLFVSLGKVNVSLILKQSSFEAMEFSFRVQFTNKAFISTLIRELDVVPEDNQGWGTQKGCLY
jgi:hypothetical protein